MTTHRIKAFITLVALFALSIIAYAENYDTSADINAETPAIYLTEERANHILYGDERGGGHLHGIGKACKSEFPKDWDKNQILETVKTIAANDNLEWRKQDNGYYVSESYEGKLKIRIVLGPKKQKIITAYPVNVVRNPCPAKPANDN